MWGALWQFPTAHDDWGLLLNKWDWERRDYVTEVLMLGTPGTIYSLLFFRTITQPKCKSCTAGSGQREAFRGPAPARHLRQGQRPSPTCLTPEGPEPAGKQTSGSQMHFTGGAPLLGGWLAHYRE